MPGARHPCAHLPHVGLVVSLGRNKVTVVSLDESQQLSHAGRVQGWAGWVLAVPESGEIVADFDTSAIVTTVA